MKIRITVIMLIICIIKAYSTNYYVSNNGNDNNTGTISSPFKTIQAAAMIMKPGDECFIRGGVYREVVRPANSGTLELPIKFSAYKNETVVVTGLDVINNWTIYKDDIYSSSVTDSVYQVFVNDKLINLARYPNKVGHQLDAGDMTDITVSADRTGTIVSKNFGTDFLKNSYLVALCGHKWVALMGKIESSVNNTFTAINTTKYWSNYNPAVYLGKGKGYFIGNLNLLDSENEWQYQQGKLYLCAPGKQNPNMIVVEGRTRQDAFDFHDLSNIQINNIQIKAASINMRSASNCLIDGCIVRYPTPFFLFKEEFNREANPEISKWSGCGIIMSGQNNTIKNTYIAHSWGDGVSIWGTNNTVDNCVIEDCNWMAVDCAPITVTGTNHTITNNSLRQTARSGLVHRYLQNGKINHNEISFCGVLTADLGITYAFNTDGKGTEMAYNWFHDNLTEDTSIGIYLDNGDKNFLVHHNVVWNCKEGVRLNTPSDMNKIYNNTLWTTNRAVAMQEMNGTKMTNVETWNNLSNKTDFSGNNVANNLTISDVGFVNSKNFNFALVANSPAIDKGKVITGITDGFTGNNPDVGAYEYGVTWKPGANIEIPAFKEDIPSLPTNLYANAISSDEIKLSWHDNSTSEDGFVIERKEGNQSDFVNIATVPANTTEFSDAGSLKASTNYTYRVRSFNNTGNSIYSNKVTLTTPSSNPNIQLEAESYSTMYGLSNNLTYISSCDNNDWASFKSINFFSPMNYFSAMHSVPASNAGQKVEIRADSKDGTLLGTMTIKSTGGWFNFSKHGTSISPISGIHDIYIVFKGTQGVGNFDWFMFENTLSNPNSIVNPYSEMYVLSQNFPNPFNNFTNISIDLKQAYSSAYLSIYSVLGSEIKRIPILSMGKNNIRISSDELKSGIYFYDLVVDNMISSPTLKMICSRDI